MKAADNNLGIHPRARAILALLADRDLDFVQKEHEPALTLKTTGWYNGREQGVALTLSRIGGGPGAIITFGECRSSDRLFVDSWWVDQVPFNAPNTTDFNEEAYKARSTHPSVEMAEEYIHNELLQAYTRLAAGF